MDIEKVRTHLKDENELLDALEKVAEDWPNKPLGQAWKEYFSGWRATRSHIVECIT